MKILYTAEVTVTGGRNGQARSRDGAFFVSFLLSVAAMLIAVLRPSHR